MNARRDRASVADLLDVIRQIGRPATIHDLAEFAASTGKPYTAQQFGNAIQCKLRAYGCVQFAGTESRKVNRSTVKLYLWIYVAPLPEHARQPAKLAAFPHEPNVPLLREEISPGRTRVRFGKGHKSPGGQGSGNRSASIGPGSSLMLEKC